METKPNELQSALAQNSVEDAATEIETGEILGHDDTRIHVASQWQLIWWRFRRHKLALISAFVLVFIYLVVLFAEFLAPYDPADYSARYTYAPPQTLHLFDDSSGQLEFRPYVNDYKVEIDPAALRRTFVLDPDKKIPLHFFVHSWSYKLFGFIPTNIHLVGPANSGDRIYLLGADAVGRDVLSRMVYGTRVSMTIGLVSVAISLLLGIFLGGISGYFGGWIDDIIQRVIDFLRSLPTIPLWLGLAAAFPITWGPLQTYFAITIILSFIGWTSLARVVRGRFLALRTEDFVMAARLDGASQMSVIFEHMLPAFYSHIIASITLAIPQVILAETALSFLGLGLRPPVVSWGVLLQDAQNVRSVATAPWLLIPAVGVVAAVLALNFLGDGLRDAADPYVH
ncbi:MAG: ABC transporter permease subunit [Anaerolineaceae bacterium]|nr:ABC transporter permease subunit [Anaerolineaceae bacterium]